MRLGIFSTFLIVLIICNDTSCTIKDNNLQLVKNDTTEIFRLLIDSAFYRKNLPEIPNLTRNNPFGDTIIFLNEIPEDTIHVSCIFPNKSNGKNFRFLSRDAICSLATKSSQDSFYFPNFLAINSFKKTNTDYEVYLQNTCVLPMFYANGKRRLSNTTDTLKCMFGIMCGGGFGMTFVRQGDSLKATVVGHWSD